MDHERCLESAEALLVDGANGVCRDVRDGAPSGHLGHVVALLGAALLVAVVLSSPRAVLGRGRVALLVLSLCAALPGAFALLVLRADRPTERARTAHAATMLHDEIRGFAARNGCARASLGECDECFAPVRLALAGLTCQRPARIELHEGALEGACRARGRSLVCGTAR